MPTWFYIAAALVSLLALGSGILLWTRDPAWIGGLIKWAIKSAVSAMLPGIIKAIKPKDLTKEQKDRINQGQEPGLPGQRKRERGW